jgi:hypothetical protein
LTHTSRYRRAPRGKTSISRRSRSALLQKSSANGGITITNAPLGLATINMTTPDSIALAGGVYPFDVIAINNSTGGHVPLTSGYWTWSDHPNR